MQLPVTKGAGPEPRARGSVDHGGKPRKAMTRCVAPTLERVTTEQEGGPSLQIAGPAQR